MMISMNKTYLSDMPISYDPFLYLDIENKLILKKWD